MDYSRLKCFYGVITPVIKNYGKSRPDMGGYCPEKFDFGFLKSVWNFNKKNRKRYYDMLHNVNDANVIIFKSHKQVRAFLKTL